MFKLGVSVSIKMLKYATLSTIGKIIQLTISAFIPSATILGMEFLLAEVTKYINAQGHQIFMAIAMLISVYIFSFINESLTQLIDIYMEKQLNTNFTHIILSKYETIQYQYYENKESQNIISRVGNNPHLILRDYFLKYFGLISQIVSAGSLFIVFMRVSLMLSVVFVIFIIIMAIENVKSTNSLNELYYEQTHLERKQNYLSELLSTKDSLAELSVFNALNYIKKTWNALNRSILKERIVKTIKAQRFRLISYLAFIGWTTILMVILFNRLESHAIEASLFITSVVSSSSAFFISQSISKEMAELSKKKFDMELFNEFLAIPIENDIGTDNLENLRMPIQVEFVNVSFVYPNTDKVILENLSFSFKSNENIAIVGENGAGKSTIIKLLCGLYRPTTGAIYINGHNLNSLNRKTIKKVFSVVFQDYAHYYLTVRENVGFGSIDHMYDEKRYQKAIHLGLADQYEHDADTMLGKIDENGIDISGGQWQRLAIARACMAESTIIILDEPTAALDPIAENDIYSHFLQLADNKGCLIISHRLASARIADRIVVLSNGNVIENDTHDNLMKKNGVYAKMFKAQQKWYQTT